jgi:hypothetical protein
VSRCYRYGRIFQKCAPNPAPAGPALHHVRWRDLGFVSRSTKISARRNIYGVVQISQHLSYSIRSAAPVAVPACWR